jgi:hypothetical protein
LNLNLALFTRDENEGGKEHSSFQIDGHGLVIDCWKLYGNPIYDTDGDVSSEKSDDLLTYEQLNSVEKNAYFFSFGTAMYNKCILKNLCN